MDIYNFGHFKLGLTDIEVKEYLSHLAQNHSDKKWNKLAKNKDRLFAIYADIAGCNTCCIGPDGQILMYRNDVERFAKLMFRGVPTYFD